jgi:hypothetical protein
MGHLHRAEAGTEIEDLRAKEDLKGGYAPRGEEKSMITEAKV